MALFRGDIYSHALKLDTQLCVIFPDVPFNVVSPYKETKVLYLCLLYTSPYAYKQMKHY